MAPQLRRVSLGSRSHSARAVPTFDYLRFRLHLQRSRKCLDVLLAIIREAESEGFYTDELTQARQYALALATSLRSPSRETWPQAARDINRLGADLEVRQWADMTSHDDHLKSSVAAMLTEMERLTESARALGWSTSAA